MDTRESTRTTLLRNVVLHTDEHRLITGKMRDLSASGMYLRLPAGCPLPAHGRVRVCFMLGAVPISVRARVARAEHNGAALSLATEETDVRGAIGRFLRRRAPAQGERSRAA